MSSRRGHKTPAKGVKLSPRYFLTRSKATKAASSSEKHIEGALGKQLRIPKKVTDSKRKVSRVLRSSPNMMGKQKQLTKQHHEGRWGKVDTPHVRDNRGKPQKPQQDHCEKPNKPPRGRTSISKKGVQNTDLSGSKVTILPLIAQTDEDMRIPRLPILTRTQNFGPRCYSTIGEHRSRMNCSDTSRNTRRAANSSEQTRKILTRLQVI